MSLDLSEFHDVFFEECHEGLETLETGLLKLDRRPDGAADTGEINAIFRAAHSIKGGSASFGFEDISAFTHLMETLLGEMRDATRAVSRPAVNLLLESVDCLRQMVDAARDESEPDAQRTGTVKQALVDMLAAGDQEAAEVEEVQKTGSDAAAEESASACLDEASAVAAQAAPGPGQTTAVAGEQDPARRAGPAKSRESGSIRVAIDKVDALVNMVGELVITQSILGQVGANLESADFTGLEQLRDGLAQLERNSRELQQSVLGIRMLPIGNSFNRFPRLVRDLAGKLNKQVDLKLYGENTEVDKTVLEKIGDPLVHLVRNALDHGLETPDTRKSSGKPESGTLEVGARHEGGNIIIEVIDDGAGLDRDVIRKKAIEKGLVKASEDLSDERIYNLVFEPGFSTAIEVSDVSGRGVGMDVVRRNIHELGGNISINSVPGKGSRITIRLPLTLAILDGQLVRIGRETCVIPMLSIIESLQVKSELLKSITGRSELYRFHDQYIPVIRLNSVFGLQTGSNDLLEGMLVVVESMGKQFALFVDEMQGQQQVVIKSLEKNFYPVQGISGATILGDGTVALILDIPGLVKRSQGQVSSACAVADTAALQG